VLVLVLGLPLAVGVAGLGGYALARRALAPIEQMTERARSITAERLSDRLPVTHPDDEMGRLASVFNETLARLESSFAQMRQFTADVSHELRTPLTSIRGYAELLKERTPSDDPDTRDAVEAIARQTAHLQRLVGNLLREAQLEHGEPDAGREPTFVATVLDEVRKGFPGSVSRIDLRVERALPSLMLDPVALHEIVANLVDNALKYSAPGAPVVVEARIEDDALMVRVSDQGPGIEPGDLPLIFDRFTQIDGSSTRAHGGVGLGLHLVRELTRRVGGDVEVDSVLGRGTTFTVSIPAHRSDATVDPTRSELSPA